jgi:hypothetical protein
MFATHLSICVPYSTASDHQVKFERYDEGSDKIRTASLLPKQIRECEERISWLKSQEATFASNKEARKIRENVLAVCKELNVLGAEQNAKLEAEFDSPDTEGLSLAIAQQQQTLDYYRAELEKAKADKVTLVSEEEAENMAVFAPVESTITLEVAQHLGDNRVRTISLGPTDGFSRGLEVIDTGAPITVRCCCVCLRCCCCLFRSLLASTSCDCFCGVDINAWYELTDRCPLVPPRWAESST